MIRKLHLGAFIRKVPFLNLLFMLLLYGGSTNAQSFVPSYVFTPTIPGPYVQITTGPVLATGTVDDDTYDALNIGFPFVYDNITYTTFSLSANGYIQMGNSLSGGLSPISDNEKNVIAAISVDLQGSNSGEIRYDTFGIAPNRKLVIQFKDWGFYSRNGDDSLDFQIVLHETTNIIDFVYGRFYKTGDDYVQVGITGDPGYQFNNRYTDDDWNATSSGFSEYDACFLSDAGPIIPFNGLTYSFAPPAKAYNTSIVEGGPAIGVFPGSSYQVVAMVKVNVDGIGSYLPLTSLTVNTAGTTNISAISNIKVFYTGGTSNFSPATQFGSTVMTPSASNIVTDSINLVTGDNYLWVTYDVSLSAVLGQFVDASIPSLVIQNTAVIPSITSPAGDREITVPMSYVSSTTTQDLTGKVARGTANNQIIGLTVVTSSTGAAANVTQFDFDATGTTDTSDITNMKVWYTGSDKNFATTAQFGATLSNLPGTNNFSITGTQSLGNDTNYFWLTYDIVDIAALTNLVDASCNAVYLDGLSNMPTVTSPTGTREIRDDYCTAIVSNAANSCNNGYYISSVNTYGADVDLSNYSGCNGNANNYINYPNKTLTVKRNQNISIELGDYSSYLTYGVWIDYNQDGVFDNTTEFVFQGDVNGNYGSVYGNFTIPCSALPGQTRMRIRGGNWYWFYAPISDPCSDIGYGETEDYNVVILDNPVSIASIEPDQHTGIVAPGTTNLVIMEIPVNTEGCGFAVNTGMHFSTTGTTATADLLNAKLYRTAPKAGFNTSNLLGTVSAPNGSFSFMLSDTLETAGTTHYWLTYDISGSATLLNNIDIRFDSIESLGSFHIPLTGNPAGNFQVSAPMTYLSSATIQPNTTKVGRGTSDNEIIGVRVITSATGAPAKLTQLDLDAIGTTDTANIYNFKVWYTGNKSTFATENQFGTTLPHLPGTLAYSITGEQFLSNDTNYFWVTYDIVDTSVLTNLVDGSCNAVTVSGIMQTPAVSTPVGAREIRVEYCTPLATDPNSCNGNYYISSVYTFGAESDLNQYTGCAGTTNNYANYPNENFVVKQNQTINMNLGDYSAYVTYTVWIDYNQDGVFNNTDERVLQNTAGGNYGFFSGNFTIPCSALPGQTRMRIRGGDYYWSFSPISSACADIGRGETQDYNIMIIGNPINVTSLEPVQTTGVVAPGTLDKVVLSVPVYAEGCGLAINTDMKFSTAGTTAASNIASAKLYRTATGVFNTSNLLGTAFSPSGQFSFTLSDTLQPSGTTNYWLAYDVNVAATVSTNLDATFDSMQVLGSYRKPLSGNPAGNVQILAPMTFVSTTATQLNNQKVAQGTTNNEVLGVQVVGSATGAPLNVTQLDFSANGTTDTSEIENIKVWYTGNSNVFTASSQFGATLPALLGSNAFVITGVQPLTNDTNYFWLTYDVKSSAAIGHVIDGEFTSITIAGTPQTPTTSVPAGNRLIKNPSCTPTPGGSPFITNITLGSMNFNPPYNGGPNYYRTFAPTTATTNLYKSDIMTLSVTSDGNAVLNAWIDFDDDGVFSPSEIIPITMATGGGGSPASTTFQVPCNAVTGSVTMRVMSRATSNPNTDPCRAGGSGEAQDYTVTIVNNPLAYSSSSAIQQTGTVAPNVTDRPILQIPVSSIGCGVAPITQFVFSTAGTTNVSNIVSAKLYRTGASGSFNTSTLLGTVSSPSGQFTFAVTDTLLQNQATIYWLAYDVSASAAVSNVLDARFDSVEVLGAFHAPTAGNPTGNVIINAPMTYLGSTVTQNMTQKVGRGDENNEVIGIQVITSSAGATINVTQLNFSTTGTTDTSNIYNMKVWYTGGDSRFGTATQFGSTLSSLPASTSFVINGDQALLNDTNYFWLTYDLNISSAIGNLIDAECSAITIAGITQTPTITAPVGTRMIRDGYCPPIASNPNTCAWGYYITSVNTTGANTNLNNYTGCNGGVNNFLYFPDQKFIATIGQNITMSLGDYSTYVTYSVWIDYNQDGIFDASERVLRTRSAGDYGNTEGTFVIPASAFTGITRMRVRSADYNWNGQYINSACTDVGPGETEDYFVEIIPLPAPQTYVWNQTSPADFTDETNWTPARVTPYANDKLVFNSGGSVEVYNVITQGVSKITVSNNTEVSFDGANNGTYLSAGDSLQLTSGKIVALPSVTLSVGYDTSHVGTVLGTGTVDGVVRRWINSSTTSYRFPLSANGKNNEVNLAYTTAPVGGTITARVVTGNPGNAGLPLVDGTITINKVSPYGVWRLTAANGYSGGTFTGSFTADGVTYVSNQADLRITKRVASIASWSLEGTGVAGTGTITVPILSRTGMSSMGEYGIGGDVSINALPVTLTSFKASNVKDDVLLSWTTASELNNAGFTIERSADGKQFTEVAFVKGYGNSSKTINYNDVDKRAFEVANSAVLYYRLQQVDMNGKTQMSDVVTVVKTGKPTSNVIAYPNPFTNGFNIEMVSAEEAVYTYSVSDIQGKVLFTNTVNINEGINRISVDQANLLSSGVYFLRLEGKEATTIKLIKTN
jgi:hypothetical protein